MSTSAKTLGRLGISETLRGFVAEMPYERRSIMDFRDEGGFGNPA